MYEWNLDTDDEEHTHIFPAGKVNYGAKGKANLRNHPLSLQR